MHRDALAAPPYNSSSAATAAAAAPPAPPHLGLLPCAQLLRLLLLQPPAQVVHECAHQSQRLPTGRLRQVERADAVRPQRLAVVNGGGGAQGCGGGVQQRRHRQCLSVCAAGITGGWREG